MWQPLEPNWRPWVKHTCFHKTGHPAVSRPMTYLYYYLDWHSAVFSEEGKNNCNNLYGRFSKYHFVHTSSQLVEINKSIYSYRYRLIIHRKNKTCLWGSEVRGLFVCMCLRSSYVFAIVATFILQLWNNIQDMIF